MIYKIISFLFFILATKNSFPDNIKSYLTNYESTLINENCFSRLDIDLINLFIKNNTNIKPKKIKIWDKSISQIKDENYDIITGVTFLQEYTKYGYFSLPYRYEKISLFTLKESSQKLHFNNISDLTTQVKLLNYRLGVILSNTYANIGLNRLIYNKDNKKIVFFYQDNNEMVRELLEGNIDGFIADNFSCTNLILSKNLENKIKIQQLQIKKPIHLFFNKKNVSLDTVKSFNHAIKINLFKKQYKQITIKHLYAELLLTTIKTKWFKIYSSICILAFSIAGLIISLQEKTNLFPTFLLALIPSMGQLIIQDVIIKNNNFIFSSNIYLLIFTVLIGYLIVKSVNKYKAYFNTQIMLIYYISNSIGQSIGIIYGVFLIILYNIEPIEIWGPILSFIISYGGKILQNVILNQDHTSYTGTEIPIIYGIILSFILKYNNNILYTNITNLKYLTAFIILSSILANIITYYTHFNKPINKTNT